ncbi:hypothetical protein [Mesorhizobium sp. L-2-11]|uniref:hypothetical protein n=1 Tax=Mesorhizobium sp. L-2-11 TaxID=2744521 RepID=UPI001925FD73|nr:hypothetical protein [Mesorhizobium sp. L-2-11]BCH18849.1 hypothetical protein MesoLjLa_57000 [Mesorhizobium sp. L-2-11]
MRDNIIHFPAADDGVVEDALVGNSRIGTLQTADVVLALRTGKGAIARSAYKFYREERARLRSINFDEATARDCAVVATLRHIFP